MTDPYTQFKPGDTIPDVTVTLLDGKKMLLSSLSSPWLLVVFISIYCPYCRAALKYLYHKIPGQNAYAGLTILVVGRDHTPDELSTFVSKTKYPFYFVPDPDRMFYTSFASRLVPRSYLINQQMNIVMQDHGFDAEEPGQVITNLQKIIGETPQ